MTSELMVENVVLQNTQSFLLLIEEKIGEKRNRTGRGSRKHMHIEVLTNQQ